MNGVIAHWSKEIGHTKIKKNKSDKNIFHDENVFLFFFFSQQQKKEKKKPDGQERPVEGLKTRKGYSQKEKQLDAFD